MQIRWPIAHRRFIANFLNQGATGMTLFFMLSGFILALNYESINLRKYAIARLARIYPVYLFAAVSTLPWIGLSGLALWTHGFSTRVLLFMFVIFINIFLIQAWFPPAFNLWNDGGSWSISTETFFYFCFPLLISNRLTGRKKSTLLFCSAYLMMNIVGLSLCLFPGSNMGVAYSIPIFRLGEFVCGVALFNLSAGISRAVSLKTLNYLLFFLSIVLIFDLGYLGANWPTYLMNDWIIIPFFATVLLVLSKERTLLSKILSLRILVLLGKASYSFYSIEVFFILLGIHERTSLSQRWPLLSQNKIFCITLFGLTQVSALLIYFLIEVPCRRRIIKKLQPKIHSQN